MLYTDAFVRDILDPYDEKKIRTMTVGQTMQLFAHGNQVRFIINRTAEGYVLLGSFGVTPTNDRSVCCSGSAQNLQFGMGFMALGGNSYPKR